MLKLLSGGSLSGKMAKTVCRGDVFKRQTRGPDRQRARADPDLRRKGDRRSGGTGNRQNPSVAEDYRNGKERALGFLVGQVMKETKGQANPGLVNKCSKKNIIRQPGLPKTAGPVFTSDSEYVHQVQAK